MIARRLLYSALVLLLLLHQDFWNWHAPSTTLGLPGGFVYHVAFCGVVSVVMALLLRLDRTTGGD